MEWLKELLKKLGVGDEEVDKIDAEVAKELPKHFVAKAQYNDVVEARKKAEKDVADRDKQLEDLKKAAGSNEELKKQIETLQTENKSAKEKYEAEAKELRMNAAVKLSLAGKVHDPDIVAGLLDKTKIELDDSGAIKAGLDDQIKALQESKAFLFVSEDKGGFQFKGAKPPEAGGGNGGGQASVGAQFAKTANESGKPPAAANDPWG